MDRLFKISAQARAVATDGNKAMVRPSPGALWRVPSLALLLTALTLLLACASDPAVQGTAAAAKEPATRPPFSRGLAQALAVGEQAPDFKVVTFDGRQLALHDYRGKIVLVAFYASWCGFCVADLPQLKALYTEFGKDRQFVMIGLNLDKNMEQGENYGKKNAIAWPEGYLGDWAKDKYAPAYQVKEIPTMFLIDPAGKIIDKEDHARWLRDSIARALGRSAK